MEIWKEHYNIRFKVWTQRFLVSSNEIKSIWGVTGGHYAPPIEARHVQHTRSRFCA